MNNAVAAQADLDLLSSAVMCAEQTMRDHLELAVDISGVCKDPDTHESVTRLKDAIQHLMIAAITIATRDGTLSDTAYRDEIAAASDAIADLWELSQGELDNQAA